MHSSTLFSALAAALCITTSEAKFFGQPTYIQYSTVTGYFLQDLNSTNATSFNYV